ncbi:hypothetical protein E3E14_14590 [Streptomyces sp. ICN441]|uniref:hypothetical protein n=1 Tax=Streptomyces TaxID=1883 RepID=UPI00106C9659|nr:MULTISPECIES: hypothetical protein [Streptomyces]MCY0983286.1 hypothetical protein [Streptomyces tirandamycinicus]TFE50249.1 hypothetical protein E3E14_14590 [Streptomyces sp. ICN441]
MNAGSAHGGFVTVRGRGYRLDQVDRYVSALARERDEAWRRAARLTRVVEELAAEAVSLRQFAEALGPPTYEPLGPRAQEVLDLAEKEAAVVLSAAREEARAVCEAAEAEARRLRELARVGAGQTCEEADARARRMLLSARATAEELRDAARVEAAAERGEAMAVLEAARCRAAGMLKELDRMRVSRRYEAERELSARDAETAERYGALTARARARLSEALCAFAEAEESARRGQEEAQLAAARLMEEAGVRAARVSRETDRVLRDHVRRAEEIHAQLDHVREVLTGLTEQPPSPD